jgi:hypothetical protein
MNDTVKLVQHVQQLSSTSTATPTSSYDPIRSLVHPIITPRFAISCTDDLLSALGTLASSDKDIRIQTHISENAGEIAETRRLFPEQASYAAVYDAFGLLRRGTVLAHGVHLSEEEMALIERRGAGVSHCPTSNFNLRSGLAPVGRMLDLGINVGRLESSGVALGIERVLCRLDWARMCREAFRHPFLRPYSMRVCARRRSRFSPRRLQSRRRRHPQPPPYRRNHKHNRPLFQIRPSQANNSPSPPYSTSPPSAGRTSVHSRAVLARSPQGRRLMRLWRARGRSVGTLRYGGLMSTMRLAL